jgi:hypothetical protein
VPCASTTTSCERDAVPGSDRQLTHTSPSSSVLLRLQSSSLALHHPQRPFIMPGRNPMGRLATAFVALLHALETTFFSLPVFLLLTMCTADAVSSHVGLLAIFHVWLMMSHLFGMVLLCMFIFSKRPSASLFNAWSFSFVPSLLYFIWISWGLGPTSFSIFVRRCRT